MAEVLLDTQKVTAIANFFDAQGALAIPPAGVVPTWASDTPAVATIDQSGDTSGLTTSVVSAGVGSANITMTAIISPSLTITATAAVTVSAAGPASATITFAAPVSK